MEKQRSDDAARLSAIVESSQDAIISKKLDGTITSWNVAAEKIFGYTPDEIIGKHISIIIPDELLYEEAEIIKKVKGGERIEHYETTRKTKEGKTVSISLTISPIKDEEGNVIGVSKIARDINAQKIADEKQAMLASIINTSDDAIVSKTLDGIITSWNKAAQKMFGYDETEAIGKHISLIIPKDRLPEETHIISQIRQGNRVDHFETIRLTKDGHEINISLSVSPIKDKQGKIIGASKIARDITEKVEAERQRQLYTEKLQELNKYKDEFMAMASHELKTPLTVIKANLQIMEYKYADGENKKFLSRTISSVDKLGDLITNLLDVSKIQAGRLDLEPTSFELNNLLAEVIDSIQQTTSTHIIVCNHCGDELMVYADKERIEQVIINMLTNAIKYSPDAGEIKVGSSKNNGEVIVSVKDSGIGIPQEDLDNIFSRFFRVQGIASTFSGSGIGLYISSEIVKRHNGRMWVESELEKGSTFYFSIPAKE